MLFQPDHVKLRSGAHLSCVAFYCPGTAAATRLRGGGCSTSKPGSLEKSGAETVPFIQDLDSREQPPADEPRQQKSVQLAARYTQPETPFALASTGDVALLSYRWLRELAAFGQALARRQELPAEAFVSVAKLRADHEALPAHIKAAVLPMLSIS